MGGGGGLAPASSYLLCDRASQEVAGSPDPPWAGGPHTATQKHRLMANTLLGSLLFIYLLIFA